MAVNPIQIYSTLDEEEERRVFAIANTSFSTGIAQSRSLNTGWKRKAGYVAGVVLSVLWIAFTGLLVFSRNKGNMVEVNPPAYIEKYQLTNKPLYLASHQSYMTQ